MLLKLSSHEKLRWNDQKSRHAQKKLAARCKGDVTRRCDSTFISANTIQSYDNHNNRLYCYRLHMTRVAFSGLTAT